MNFNKSFSILIERTQRTKLSVILFMTFLLTTCGFGGQGDISWMIRGKYGIFFHYQYRILLGYGGTTKPMLPSPSQMTGNQWNLFVTVDVKGFAGQMDKAKVGWVMFCLDDHPLPGRVPQ
jgi:hypothetical protein